MDYYDDYGVKAQGERSRWTPLTRLLLSGQMTQERQRELTTTERFNRWMVNEGPRRMYVCSLQSYAGRLLTSPGSSSSS